MESIKETIKRLDKEIDELEKNSRYVELREKHRAGKITMEENMELNTYYQTHTRLLIAYNGLLTEKANKRFTISLILSVVSIIITVIGLII